MKINLQHITPDAELEIVRIARVSSPRQDKDAEPEKLIRYLIDHKHWSPFEMANMCIEIECTIASSIQILRHRSLSFQQFSQRYASVMQASEVLQPVTFYYQDESKNRQMSTDQLFDNSELLKRVESIQAETIQLYQELLDAGCSRETARYILPMNTTTRLYANGTIRSWIHYSQSRLDQRHVQPEHYELACRIAKIFKEQLPTIYKACRFPENY